MSVTCLPCAIGYHQECWTPTDKAQCHCTLDSPVVAFVGTSTVDTDTDTPEKKERGGQIKEMSKVTDLESTGRKRAAKLYPIPKEGEPNFPLACEWKGLAGAGGGVIPIVGCFAGLATHIHHGPDKNTLSNFVGNVHRLCTYCHNRWHGANDSYYSGVRPTGETPYVPAEHYKWYKHDGVTKATEEQLAQNEIAWASSSWREFYQTLGKEIPNVEEAGDSRVPDRSGDSPIDWPS